MGSKIEADASARRTAIMLEFEKFELPDFNELKKMFEPSNCKNSSTPTLSSNDGRANSCVSLTQLESPPPAYTVADRLARPLENMATDIIVDTRIGSIAQDRLNSPPPSYNEALLSSMTIPSATIEDLPSSRPASPTRELALLVGTEPPTFRAKLEEVITLAPQRHTSVESNFRENQAWESDIALSERKLSNSSNFTYNRFRENSIYSRAGSVVDNHVYEELASPRNSLNNVRTLAIKNLPEISNNILFLKQSALNLDPLEYQAEWHAVVDTLFTSACGGNGMSKNDSANAAKFIFNLYTHGVNEIDKTPIKNALLIQEILQEKSLDLFEKVENYNTIVQIKNAVAATVTPDKEPDTLWVIPTELLIMAGFNKPFKDDEIEGTLAPRAEIVDLRPEIAMKINNNINYMIEIEGPGTASVEMVSKFNKSFFDAGRFIYGNEIDSFSDSLKLNNNNNRVTFHNAMALPVFSSNEISNLDISVEITEKFKSNEHSSKANFAPILLNKHWYLFGTFIDNDNKKSALVFDSKGWAISKEVERNYFEKLAESCGVNDSITYVSEDLQQNAPNACGLFVAKAMEKLTTPSIRTYADSLSEWNNEFKNETQEYQELFNRRGRAELFNTLGEKITHDMGL